MGGAAKGIANTVGRVGSGVFTLGGSELARNNLPKRSVANQVLNAPGTILTGGQSSLAAYGGDSGVANPYVGGPFSLDPAQYAKDQADITGLGQKQYSDTIGAIDTNDAAQTQRAKDLFGQMLPDIAENSQAAHLYDSSGYGNEVARQQSQIASQVAANSADKRMAALSGRQGFETGALQRGQSLEDFINQANVAKTIGAQTAPQMPSGKATGLSGGVAGAGAGAPFGPIGALAGGAGGYLLGSQANKKGGK